jgi:small subunit ribosomal protein S14
MKNLVQKDKRFRSNVKKFERKRLILKSIIKNMYLTDLVKWNAILKLTQLPSNSSKVYVTNRCTLTGRRKYINKFYRFSRIEFLKLARSGNISNLRKSTW